MEPYHVGPAIPEVNSLWFKLFVYHVTGSGPPSLLLCKGTRLRTLPKLFASYSQLLITSWGHDPGLLPTSNALFTVNDALTHSPVLLQVAQCFRSIKAVLYKIVSVRPSVPHVLGSATGRWSFNARIGAWSFYLFARGGKMAL